MYSLEERKLFFNEKECYEFPKLCVINKDKETSGYCLKQKGATAIISISEDIIFNDLVYLFNEGNLTTTFTIDNYHITPCVEIIRDYFIIYVKNEDEVKKSLLQLYTLKGELIKNISYQHDMVWGLRVIDDDYFILYEWYWGPFFLRTLYNFNKVLEELMDNSPRYQGIDIEIQHLDMDEQMDFVIMSREEAILLESRNP